MAIANYVRIFRLFFSRRWGRKAALDMTPDANEPTVPRIKPAFSTIPKEIICQIASLLSTNDVLSWSLTSKALRSTLIPPLYSTVILRSSRQCAATLGALAYSPHIAHHIRKLKVYPHSKKSRTGDKTPRPGSEFRIAELIVRIAMQGLPSLHTFAWGGTEMPSEKLWYTLQSHCPLLRAISVNAGTKPLNHNSNLYNFRDLTEFVFEGLPASSRRFYLMEPLPDKLWNMLLYHCPKLISLRIDSTLARPFACNRVAEGLIQDPSGNEKFEAFLNAHPSIQHLHLGWYLQRDLDAPSLTLPATALPQLRSFDGVYTYIAALPSPDSVHTLKLQYRYVPPDVLPDICIVLRRFTALTSLTVLLGLPDADQPHHELFSELAVACPHLIYLHIACYQPFTKDVLTDLAAAFAPVESLRTLKLTDWFTSGTSGIDMGHIAARLVRGCPQLRHVVLRWGPHASDMFARRGSYNVCRNAFGAVLLRASETVPVSSRIMGKKSYTTTLRDYDMHGNLISPRAR